MNRKRANEWPLERPEATNLSAAMGLRTRKTADSPK